MQLQLKEYKKDETFKDLIIKVREMSHVEITISKPQDEIQSGEYLKEIRETRKKIEGKRKEYITPPRWSMMN